MSDKIIYRATVTKMNDALRFVSHLEFVTLMQRSIRRANLPAVYSEGFHPHMKLSFANALAVGWTSESELFEFSLKEEKNPEEIKKLLNENLPNGVEIKKISLVTNQTKPFSELQQACYKVFVPYEGEPEKIQNALEDFEKFPRNQTLYVRQTPKKTREIYLKDFIMQKILFAHLPNEVLFDIKLRLSQTEGSVKPTEILEFFHQQFHLFDPEKIKQAHVHRYALRWSNELK